MNRKELIKQVGNERIRILFNAAEARIEIGDTTLAKSYIKRLKKISAHYKIKLGKEMKSRICKKCNALLIPGKTCSVRIVSAHRYVSYECNACKSQSHIFY
ncbi:MAG: ribonuclease P Rpr2/Rpp21/SNM1 subunit [Candidatus Marsarchaeota archaeon]|nr:ribonuclease P Rpr2/Rpp21/SNM1 subunit [Candidatus Marsarchaeota archaeon]